MYTGDEKAAHTRSASLRCVRGYPILRVKPVLHPAYWKPDSIHPTSQIYPRHQQANVMTSA